MRTLESHCQCLGHAAIRPRLYRPYGIAITDEASPLHLPSTRNHPRTAVRRGAASCRAVLRSCPVTAVAGSAPRSRHGVPRRRRGTRARFAPPSRRSPSSWPSRMSGRRPRRSSRCPRPLSAMRTDVRPTGRADVRCPGDRCPRDRGDPGVRTDRRPASAAAAAALSAPRWIRNTWVRRDRPRLVHRVRRVALVGERLGRRCPNRARRGGMVERWPCAAGTMVDARPGPPLGIHPAAAPRSPPGRPRSWSSARCRSVGGGARRSRCSQVPRRCVWAGCRLMLDHGAGLGRGDHARWSLRWWWSPVVRLWRAHPVQRGADCGRGAAAACQERCPPGADSALTSENSGGRDRI